jgi:hypothetical protein
VVKLFQIVVEVNLMTNSTPNSAPNPTPNAKIPETWMPTAAGILAILAGAGDLLLGLITLAVGHAIGRFSGIWGFGLIGVPHIILGIISIVGGVFALRRQTWWLALVGAILALMWPSTLFGILSIIFVALSKKEFK